MPIGLRRHAEDSRNRSKAQIKIRVGVELVSRIQVATPLVLTGLSRAAMEHDPSNALEELGKEKSVTPYIETDVTSPLRFPPHLAWNVNPEKRSGIGRNSLYRFETLFTLFYFILPLSQFLSWVMDRSRQTCVLQNNTSIT